MSEAPHVPFTETKAPESAERLHRGALRLIDISASTMANIGPAYSFMFGRGSTDNPRRNVPRAVFLSIALMAVTYLLLAYSTVSRFQLQRQGARQRRDPVHHRGPRRGGLAGLLRLHGRDDLHPRRAHRRSELAVPADLQRLAARAWCRAGSAGCTRPGGRRSTRSSPSSRWPASSSRSGPRPPDRRHTNGTGRAELLLRVQGTMGTILILVVYFLGNWPLPFFYRKFRPQEFSVVKHIILPVLAWPPSRCRSTTCASRASPTLRLVPLRGARHRRAVHHLRHVAGQTPIPG